jgi:hypothetical protein
MSLVITVGPTKPCFDPLGHFQSHEDKQALRLFKNGAVLHLRQDGARPSYRLEHLGTTHRFKPNSAITLALQTMGRQVGIDASPDETAPVERWVFAPEKLATLSKRWRHALSCANDWLRNRGPLTPSTSGLSEKALATLRYMKRQYAMCMHRELYDVWLELNARGLLEVNPNGGAHLRPSAEDISVPWGPILKLTPATSGEAIVALDAPTGAIPPVALDVANPVSCLDPLARFRKAEGKQILDLFKARAVLHLHRGATTHNWWLAHKDGREHHFGRDAGTARALTSFANHTGSRGVVPHTPTFIHNDGGKPMEETWEFSATKLTLMTLEWASAEECAEDWNRNAGEFDKSSEGLSEMAKATLRTLQQKYTLPMHPELFEVWLELNAKGYLEVFPEGYAQLVPAAREVFVVHGPRLELKYPKLTKAAR